MIKRVLVKKFYRRVFPASAIQAAKRIKFEMREQYLVPAHRKYFLRPVPVRTKYCNYVLSVSIIFRKAWERVLDNPTLSYYFPNSSFPVWYNHRNLKNFLSYKNRDFEQYVPDREYKDYIFQKFNRPKFRKRCNTL